MTASEPGGDPFLQALGRVAHLPEAIKVLHSRPATHAGLCDIERGKGLLLALILAIGRFPPSGVGIPVTLKTKQEDVFWYWDRDFAGHRTRSKLSFDARNGCVCETLGGLCIWLQPDLVGDKLRIQIKKLTVLGVPCPRIFLPQSATVEWQDETGRYRFDVSAKVPILGQLIRYQGWLTPDHSQAGDA